MRSKLLLCALVSLGCLIAGEAVVRRWSPRPGLRPFPEDQPRGLYVAHPGRSYTYAPDYSGTIDAREYRIRIATNGLGLRDDPVAPGETIDILAVGDSFTVGFGVEAAEAWPAELERFLNWAEVTPRPLRVLNGAVSAYGLVQIRQRLEELLDLHPSLVVIGLYPKGYWRLDNPYVYSRGYVVSRDSAPHYDVTDDGFVYTRFENRILQRVHLWSMKHFHLGAEVLEAARTLSSGGEEDSQPEVSAEALLAPFLAELERISRLCRSHRVRLVVLLVNSQRTDGRFDPAEIEYNRVITAYCQEAGISALDPIPIFRRLSRSPVFRIGGDAHWSRHAHQVVGRELGAFLLRDAALVDALRDRRGVSTSE